MKFNFMCVSLCVCMGLMCEHFDLTNLTRHFALWILCLCPMSTGIIAEHKSHVLSSGKCRLKLYL